MQCQSIAVKHLEPLGKPAVVKSRFQGLNMGPGYFVIAILGCADGGAQCTPVATAPDALICRRSSASPLRPTHC